VATPSDKVHGSSMLWSTQVGIIDAMDAMDYVGPGDEGLELLRQRRQPVIYPFNRNGKPGFVAPLDPYA
jgi:hypothetical protein